MDHDIKSNHSTLDRTGAAEQQVEYDLPVDQVIDDPTEVLEHEHIIDLNIDYPTDPYLFQKVSLTPRLIRAIIEAGPCQPGFDNNEDQFPTDEDGFKFKSTWYVKESKSGSVQRKWLVYSPKSDKMF